MGYDWEALYVFILALVLTFLFSVKEIVEKELYVNRSKWERRILVTSKSVIGALVGVTVYNALQQLQIEISLFDITFVIKDSVAVFLTVSSIILLDDLIFNIRGKLKGDNK